MYVVPSPSRPLGTRVLTFAPGNNESGLPEVLNRKSSRTMRYSVFGITGLGLASMALYLVIAMAYIGKFIAETDTTSFEPDSPDFDFFKNSRFKECYNTQPDAANCSVIADLLRPKAPPENQPGAMSDMATTSIVSHSEGSPISYDWCQVAGCLNGFKIIPSTPRHSALGLAYIGPWCFTAVLLFSSNWHMNSRNMWLYRGGPKPCRGLRDLNVVDWVLIAHGLIGPLVWWWVTFFRFAADRTQVATLSILSWATMWKFGGHVQYHPYWCAFPRASKVLARVLMILAIIQWGAAVYVLSVHFPIHIRPQAGHQAYDCLASRVAEAPGTSSCSTEQLC